MLEFTCSICGKKLDISADTHFVLTDMSTQNDMDAVVLCEKCAGTTTVMDMYLSGKITMANSLDDVLETDGVVVDSEKIDNEAISEANGWSYVASDPVDIQDEAPLATSEEVEKFFTSAEPVFTS